MQRFLKLEYAFLQKPLNMTSRILLVIAALVVAASLWFPLWQLHLEAPQYEEGLRLDVYAWKIEGGRNGTDLNEINTLNHYIGMKPIRQADFTEMQVMPFMIGLFILLALRAVVFGQISSVIDLLAITIYFGLFSIGAFYYRLYHYGHTLDPQAAMSVKPFTPLLLGTQKIANFTQSSYPQAGTYILSAFTLLLILAIWLSRKEQVCSQA